MASLRAHGLPNLYPAIAVACITALGCAVWSGEAWAPRAVAPAAWLAALCAVLGYGFELRRDPVTAARVALIPTLFVAIFGGAGFLGGSAPARSPALAAAVVALPALAVLGVIVRMQWGAEAFPNLLRRQFGAHAGEERGVQMAVAAPRAIRTGELCIVEVYLQNTWDAPRVAIVTVGGKGFWRARYPAPFEVTLEPLAVSVATMPFAIEESEIPRIQLVTEISVTGTGGRRRRLWRAPRRAGRPRRAYTHMQAAALERGTAGGIPVDIAVTGARAEPPTLPSTTLRSVWCIREAMQSLVRY